MSIIMLFLIEDQSYKTEFVAPISRERTTITEVTRRYQSAKDLANMTEMDYKFHVLPLVEKTKLEPMDTEMPKENITSSTYLNIISMRKDKSPVNFPCFETVIQLPKVN